MAEGVHCNEGAGFEVWFNAPNGAEHDVADGDGKNILGSDLNDTGLLVHKAERHSEIEVMCEDDPPRNR
jgi:hypothetical protein